MAFFLPRTIYHSQPYQSRPYHSQSSSPLYNLLNDVDAISRRRSREPVYYVYRTVDSRRREPDFKAQETANVYLIRGQVPQVTKENLTIDFPEPQKMVIRGKVVEAAQKAPAAEPQVEPVAEAPAPPSPASESGSSRKSYQATVEDDYEDDEFDMVSELSTDEHGNAQPSQTPARQEEKLSPQPQPVATVPEPLPQSQEDATPRVLYEFSKTFTFANPVDYQSATADLKDGVLTVVVPKPKKAGPRRILIN